MNEKGITIIQLIITVIITTIIAGVAFNAAIEDFSETNSNVEKSELELVGHAIMQTKVKYDIANESLENLHGKKIEQSTYDEINAVLSKQEISLLGAVEDYWELTPQNGLKEIGIENTENTYVVNFVTGEVFNYTKQKAKDGSILYSSPYGE